MHGNPPRHKVRHEPHRHLPDLIPAKVNQADRVHMGETGEEGSERLIRQPIVVEDELGHEVIVEGACIA